MSFTFRAMPRAAVDRARSTVRAGAIALLSLAALAACGGGGDSGGTTTPPPAASIALSAASNAVTVSRGGTVSVTMLVARTNYTGAVTFTTTGLPTGVTATFEPASISGSTNAVQMTLAAGATATSGVVTVQANGTGVSSATATVTVTVNAPTITLTAGAGTASVVAGQSTTVPVTITRGGGFADAVTVTPSGLPTGVTAPAITIAAGSTTGTITLTAAANAAAGTSAVTLTATGTGVTAQTATVTLTVTAAATPAISLAAAPAAVSVQAGASGTSTVTLTRSGGFAGEVALAISGAPTGVTATAAPASIAAGASTSTVTLAVGANATPGLYNLTVTGSGTGVTAATTTIALTVAAVPSIAISAAPATVSLTPGGTATSTITLVRTNFTADVALAAGNLPTGVTAAFSPASLTGTTLTSTLTLTAAANAAVGTQNITVTASGTGVTAATATIGTTVSAAQGYALSATSATAQQGSSGTSTITITRTGGYTGAVTFTVGTLPSGVTAVVSPNPSTTGSATVTFTAASNAATGSSNVTISGAGAGLTGTVTTTVPLTITAGGGGGSGNVNLLFCDAAVQPSFVAYRDGTSGPWTRVSAGPNNSYSFTIRDRGGLLWAVSTPTSSAVVVWYGSATELSGITSSCQSTGGKSLSGTFAGLGPLNSASVSVGTANASTATPGSSAFALTGVKDGVTDLLAFRSTINPTTASVTPDRGVLRRDVNYPSGSTIPVIDFNSAESFAPASARITAIGLEAGSVFGAASTFATSNGETSGFQGFSLNTGGNTATVYGLPSSLLRPGDLQFIAGISQRVVNGNTDIRTVTRVIRALTDQSLELGPQLIQPTYSTAATSPYTRIRAQGPFQNEYNGSVLSFFSQSTPSVTRQWTVLALRSYFAQGAGYDFEIPSLSGTSGWNDAFGFVSGFPIDVFTQATGGANSGPRPEGALFRSASLLGRFTP